tara:strand:- start:246 stop:485 length:240 start_codon:yes stop_codon:yes gene_type:complete
VNWFTACKSLQKGHEARREQRLEHRSDRGEEKMGARTSAYRGATPSCPTNPFLSSAMSAAGAARGRIAAIVSGYIVHEK